MVPSRLFDLPFFPNGVDVHVRAGSLVGYIFGLAFAVEGLTFTGIGGAALTAYEALGQPRVVNNTPGALLPVGLAFFSIVSVRMRFGTRCDASRHNLVLTFRARRRGHCKGARRERVLLSVERPREAGDL
jgi:hypothetical protein